MTQTESVIEQLENLSKKVNAMRRELFIQLIDDKDLSVDEKLEAYIKHAERRFLYGSPSDIFESYIDRLPVRGKGESVHQILFHDTESIMEIFWDEHDEGDDLTFLEILNTYSYMETIKEYFSGDIITGPIDGVPVLWCRINGDVHVLNLTYDEAIEATLRYAFKHNIVGYRIEY